MRWTKLGLIFCPDNNHPWMVSHAANPVAEHLGENRFRLNFSCRDVESRSHVGYVELELEAPFRILKVASEPLLAPGEIGAFDDSGVSLSCIRQVGGKKFLYYLGWNLGVTVPWRNAIGLAIYNERSGVYERFSRAPLLDRHDVDPFSLSYPFILEDSTGYRMWYGSNLKWGGKQEDMAHVIKYAESPDAIHWERKGTVALQFANEREYAMSRPCVIKEGGLYRMWYSYRGSTYRIGYAESKDGLSWVRKDDEAGIDVSASGWDSEMIEYPFVFSHAGRRYMFYNGNGYGRTGVGLAVLE